MYYGCRYYEHKKSAFKKEQKTIAASEKVFFLQPTHSMYSIMSRA